MELTEQQKKISTSQKFWEMQAEKKQVEISQQQPVAIEEANKIMKTRKAFLKKCGKCI